MIDIRIKSNEEGVITSFNHENMTYEENAVALRVLEELKSELLSFKFKPKFETRKGDGDVD